MTLNGEQTTGRLAGWPVRAPFLAALLGVAGLAACGESPPMCDNQIIREAVSPDGKLKASVFHRSCGGPTGFSSQVSIFGAKDAVAGKGNVFIADTDDGRAHAEAWGGPDVKVEWTTPQSLKVTFAPFSRVLAQAETVRGISISYHSTVSQ